MAHFNRIILVPAALLALSACATPTPGGPGRSQAASLPANEPSSVYGLYLAGQVALDASDNQRAADLFGRARAISVDGAFLKEKTFTAALLAGDLERAATAGGRPFPVIVGIAEALDGGSGRAVARGPGGAGDQ